MASVSNILIELADVQALLNSNLTGQEMPALGMLPDAGQMGGVDAGQQMQASDQQGAAPQQALVPRPSAGLLRFAPGVPRVPTAQTKAEPDAGPTEDVADEPTMEEMEERCFAGLKMRPILKRPATQPKEGEHEGMSDSDDETEPGDGHVAMKMMKAIKAAKSMKAVEALKTMKAMKVHSAPVMKAAPKKASAPAPTKGKKPVIKVALDKSELKATTMKNLASVWYNRTRAAFTKAGFSDEEGKTAARKAHTQLQDFWRPMEAAMKKKTKA